MFGRFAYPGLSLISLALVLAMGLITASTVVAAPANGLEFETMLRAEVKAGDLTTEEALLYRFFYAFDQEQLPIELRPESPTPLKNGTSFVQAYRTNREHLSPATVAVIDRYLNPTRNVRATETYISPDGWFRLSYETTGTHAVPLEDVDPANGVPDFIEKLATYFDTSWDVEFTQLGFAEPPHAPYYEIEFQEMDLYGYTDWISGLRTKIVMHRDYLDFPPNQDPEGNRWGAAKVTAAHELKHASQLPQSDWSEGDWSELDAVWTEDLVFDQVNDYYNYFSNPNNISQPSTPLDSGGTGSYEDSIWQHWMSETWGNEIIVDFGDWRGGHISQPVLESYVSVLETVAPGVSFADHWATYSAWNYATGSRAIPGLGYAEAADYPTSPALGNIFSYPATKSDNVAHLAADFLYCLGLSSADGWVSYKFNGENGGLCLAAVIKKTDGTGLIEILDLDEASDAIGRLSVPRQDIYSVGFIVGNSALAGSDLSWTLTVDLELPDAILDLNIADLNLTVSPDLPVDTPVVLSNIGAPGSQLDYRVIAREPIAESDDKSIGGTTFTCNVAQYDPGTTVDLEFSVTNGSTDDEWLIDTQIIFPAGVTVNQVTDFVGGGGGPMLDDGSQGDGVTVSWHGDSGAPDYWGVVGNGQTARATVNVTFDENLVGDLALGYKVDGDVWGGFPHSITGQLILNPRQPELTLLGPVGNTHLPIGQDVEISWSSLGDTGDVSLDLTRDGGLTWESITSATANDGVFVWTAAGPATAQARVRISALSGTIQNVGSGLLTLYQPAVWVTAAPSSGQVDFGDSESVLVTIDATGMTNGDYDVELCIIDNTQLGQRIVPVHVRVQGGATAIPDAPAFALHGNHPNPFNPSTIVSFSIPTAGSVTVDVVDLRGALVKRLCDEILSAGDHSLHWMGRDDHGRQVAAGTYLLRLRADGYQASGKMVLAK